MDMQQTAPTGNVLGALFFLAAIVVWATSPSKWKTFKKMAVAFVGTVAAGIVVGLAIGYLYSSPHLTGGITELSVDIGVVAAFIMGRQHVRSLKSKGASKPANTAS